MIELTINLPEAHQLKQALDLLARIGIGQLEYTADHIRSSIGSGEDITFWEVKRIETMLLQCKATMGYHHPNSSFGIFSPSVSLPVKRAYEVYKTLARAIIELRDQPDDFLHSVDYDGLRMRCCGREPAPTATTPSKDAIRLNLPTLPAQAVQTAIATYGRLLNGDFSVVAELVADGTSAVSDARRVSPFGAAAAISPTLNQISGMIGTKCGDHFVDDRRISAEIGQRLSAQIENAAPLPEP
jgi:hypothetical protein